LTQVVAEALYGEGSFPFNAATGWTVRADSERVAQAVHDVIVQATDPMMKDWSAAKAELARLREGIKPLAAHPFVGGTIASLLSADTPEGEAP
jgi:hypothetical protein